MCKSICMYQENLALKTTIDMSMFLVLYINFIKNNKFYYNYLKYSVYINNNYGYSYDCRLYYLLLIFKIDNSFLLPGTNSDDIT